MPDTYSMHVFFSGVGGAGIGPLALVARQAGFDVSGSDKQNSSYIRYLQDHGISDISISQSYEDIAAVHARKPIDWYVYSSAVAIEQPDSPEFRFCREHGIRMSKRDELLSDILGQKHLKLIAIAGTHGKTTTTAMTVWAMKQLGIPIGYILPAKSSFADMGAYEPGAEYFVYECDEYDRNFLAFHPELSLITGIDWDHPDIYPTRDDYESAFRDFVDQSKHVLMWPDDAERIALGASATITVLNPQNEQPVHLPGAVNRKDATLVIEGLAKLLGDERAINLAEILSQFPGVSRRFEQLYPGLYSDYAHTPPKIRGALQLGREVAGDNLVVIYEGLHNTRQHFMQNDLAHLFDGAKQLYIVPSYLARENESLELLTPDKLRDMLSEEMKARTAPAVLDDALEETIRNHLADGDTVVCLTAGGGGSLDEWLRERFAA